MAPCSQLGTHGSPGQWPSTKQHVKSDTAVREMLFMHTAGAHPNLIQLQETFVQGSTVYLVLQYARASLWDEWKRAGGLLPWDEVTRYGRHMLQGVEHLHHMGVVHRDLGMPNILIHEGSAIVADLGMAACASNLVLEETVTTAAFRAPEVLLGCTHLERPSAMDMWFCGVVLAALFMGQLPFGDGNGSKLFVFENQVCCLAQLPEKAWPSRSGAANWEAYKMVVPTPLPTQSGFIRGLPGGRSLATNPTWSSCCRCS